MVTAKKRFGQNFLIDPGKASKLVDALNIKDGEPVRVESKVGKVIVQAKISDYLDSDVVLIPRNFPSKSVTSVLMRKRRIDRVKLSKVDE